MAVPRRQFALTGMPRIAWPEGPYDIFYFNDFINKNDFNDWTFGDIGTNTSPTGVSSFDGGKLRLNHTTATDNTGQLMESAEFFKFSANRRYLWAARVAMDDGTNGDVSMGMSIAIGGDPANLAAAASTDGVLFGKDDGDDNIDYSVHKDTTTTATGTDVATATASAEYATFAIYVETYGAVTENLIEFYVDGVLVGSISNSAELVDDEEMCLRFLAHNGATGGPNFLDIDWVLFQATRAA